MSSFPDVRLRRFRRTAPLRGLVRETRLSLDQFVMPYFVAPEPLANDDLPGMARFTVDGLLREVDALAASGVQAVMLFGIPSAKDEEATGAWEDDGIVQQALRALPLAPWAARRRQDLLGLLQSLDEQVAPLDRAVQAAAEESTTARLLMQQPGVGPITALAFVLTIGDVSRFPRGKQVASYLGLIPREHSSGGRQKLGGITKQGNRMMRYLLVEAAHQATRYDAEFKKEYLHRCHARPKQVAKVAAARKLAVKLYWMLRTAKAHSESVAIESSPRVPLVGAS